jgi:hypothetical protein
MKQLLLPVHLFFTLSILTGCASSIYGWQVRTASTPFPPSLEPAFFQREGLAVDYMRMKEDYEQSNIFDRGPLSKIGTKIGARYVFQIRLAPLRKP